MDSGMNATIDSPVNPADRLIHALDTPTVRKARDVVQQIGDAVSFYKVGLELFMDPQAFELIGWLREQNKHVFADLKFFDIPNTMAAAVRGLSRHDVQFATVHGNDAALEAAVQYKGNIKLLAVTALSSVTQDDLKGMGLSGDLDEWALQRARRAQDLGCDGVICAGSDIAVLRQSLKTDQLIVAPGIRPESLGQIQGDDQKRTAGVCEALDAGADYIVVGRPIAHANNPRVAAMNIQQEIANCL
jgi:orotidine-5'-phosphate decarboxylase